MQASERELTAIADMLAKAVREAGELALTYRKGDLKHWTKEKDSPVSEADIAVDALLKERLVAPGFAWLSEESEDDGARLTARRVWVVDPIDGTRSYIGGLQDWAVSAALVEDGRPVVAALYAPAYDEFFTAIAGRGALRNGTPIMASGGGGLAGARVAGPRKVIERLTAVEPAIQPMPRVFSLALRFARVAEGKLDAAIAAPASRDWDLAAADLLVHEARGILATLAGEPVAYNRSDPVHGSLVAAAPSRHRALSDLLQRQPT